MKKTHGLGGTYVYKVWHSMMHRCYDVEHRKYEDYGGRGITVCREWLTNVQRFKADMGKRPSDKHSLDRIDNDGMYEPSNCRWATCVEQANNRRPRNSVSKFKIDVMTPNEQRIRGLANSLWEKLKESHSSDCSVYPCICIK